LAPAQHIISPGIEAVMLKCLSKRAEHRYQSMEELSEDLRALRAGEIPKAARELAESSSGFNAPADYFERESRALVPGQSGPSSARSWTSAALLVLVLGLGGVVLFLMTNQKQDAPVVEAEPPTVAPAPVDENIVITTQVALAVEPLSAHVFQGDKDLGTSPVVVEVPEGAHVDVEVRLEGFKAQALTLDGATQKISVKLEKLPNAAKPKAAPPRTLQPRARAPQPAPAPKQKQAIGGSEILNPWAR
jgi:serine/threonine-protein kinase